MKVKQECSKLVKPLHEGDPPSTQQVRLNVFDLITDDAHMPVIYAYRLPTPTNAALELGLQKVSAVYRELAGRFDIDDQGYRVILLNDEGVRVVEVSVDCPLDEDLLLKPSDALLSFHPCLEEVNELIQIQLTRFTCGSLLIGFSTNHMVADGHYVSQFLVAWGRACRGLEISRRPVHNRDIFVPRDPPLFDFEHIGVEYKTKTENCSPESLKDFVMNRYRFEPDLLLEIKAKASVARAYTRFESVMAHVWRRVAKACEHDGYKDTCLRIAVNGTTRLKPGVPSDYFGNLVLWAYPRTHVKELINRPLDYGAELIHEAVRKVNDSYFKSFIDFSLCKVDKEEEEELVPKLSFSDNVTSLNLNVDSWLGFPFCDLDFGCGKPYIFTPSYRLWVGQVYVVPSVDAADGSIDVFLALKHNQLDSFSKICYSLD